MERSREKSRVTKSPSEKVESCGSISGGLVTASKEMDGDVNIEDHLEIAPTGNVQGEIHVPAGKLIIHEGAEQRPMPYLPSERKISLQK